MKERDIPMRDIKIGFKVVGKLASNIIEEVSPQVQNELGRQFRQVAKKLKGNRI